MASVTMPPAPALPEFAHSPLTSSLERNSPSFESNSPLPSPPAQLNPAFVFPERKSMEQERSAPMAPDALPTAGGSHGRRKSRQGRPALPDFKFNPGAATVDAASAQPSPTSPKIHPVLEQMAANSQRMRAGRPNNLPAFSFNPGAASEFSRTPSPTKSTFGDSLQRPAHRRGGSELVGSEGPAVVVSTSPVRAENKVPKGPPVTNHPVRGHKHRRSGAMSQADIDLSSIIKANAMSKHRGASAPSTPADVNSPTFFEQASASGSTSPDSRKSTLVTPPASPGRHDSLPGQPQRPRVAFSETVAEIPRPLSMISSATEDSTSTVRASHSASNSVNSFTSPARSGSSLCISGEEPEEPQRPKSAGAACLTSHPGHIPSPSTSPKRPLSASGTPSPSSASQSPPFKKKFFWSGASSDNGDQEAGDTQESATVSDTTLPAFAPTDNQELIRPRTSPERKASLKKRKVKTSIGGIFSRKGKHRSSRPKSRRTPTPPLTRPGVDPVFDNDDTVVIEDPAIPPSRPPLLETQPRHDQSLDGDDKSSGGEDRNVISPVIDLDAALGPFGSDERFPDANAAPAAWRRMHSGKGLADPSGYYHRRAESAPHLPHVSRNALGFSRMGSNPSMSEQAIDEEEEDQYLASAAETIASADDASQPGQGEAIEDASVESDEESLSGKLPSSPGGATESNSHGESQAEASAVNNRCSVSTIMAPSPNDFLLRRPVSAPMDITVSTPQGSYASSVSGRSGVASLISSPEADRISFARYPGDHSHEIFPRSADDVPSLTDSVSTATGHVPRISSSANTRSSTDQRSASFSGFAPWSPTRTSKRASLVSLTRLIPGSSHGEKSKLRFGQTVQDEEQEKQQKRKSNRLSRLMTFWRPKDKP